MPGFLDQLRQEDQTLGSQSGYPANFPVVTPNNYGASGTEMPRAYSELSALMPLFHQIRNRNLEDFKAKTQFAHNLDMQQGNLRSAFDPSQSQHPTGAPPLSGMNTVFKDNPNAITPYQRGELDLGKAKLAADTRSGDAKLALSQASHDLDVKKNEQIYNTKQDEMQRKVDDSNNRLQLAYDQLQARQGDAAAINNFKQAQLDATNARHELDLAQRDKELTETKSFHDSTIQRYKDAADAAGFSIEELQTDPNDENKQVRITRKGSAADKTNAPKAPAGWKYVRKADGKGWTAVQDNGTK